MKKTPINVAHFEPLDSKVLIEPDGSKKSAILRPDSVSPDKFFLPFGTVIACGPGRWDTGVFIPMDLVPGDRVQVSIWQGVPVEVNGNGYICLERAFIIGKIKDALAS